MVRDQVKCILHFEMDPKSVGQISVTESEIPMVDHISIS